MDFVWGLLECGLRPVHTVEMVYPYPFNHFGCSGVNRMSVNEQYSEVAGFPVYPPFWISPKHKFISQFTFSMHTFISDPPQSDQGKERLLKCLFVNFPAHTDGRGCIAMQGPRHAQKENNDSVHGAELGKRTHPFRLTAAWGWVRQEVHDSVSDGTHAAVRPAPGNKKLARAGRKHAGNSHIKMYFLPLTGARDKISSANDIRAPRVYAVRPARRSRRDDQKTLASQRPSGKGTGLRALAKSRMVNRKARLKRVPRTPELDGVRDWADGGHKLWKTALLLCETKKKQLAES
ncbi:hypothetical protein GGX14DRAFT_393410 [Mycena pura]|uniref:Uncharacterized protein n=1 Tax=Mycena pura TaxID=153505 RepID=A0AAD6YCZ6_9AGAR|nr:hypothetical protein GGX14DRAFT_393410 [Mycena pura]